MKVNKSFFLLLSFFVLSSIAPTRRFAFEYAWIFKSFYLSFIGIALWKLCFKKLRLSRWFTESFLVFGIALIASIISSNYVVRAGSELDILLAAFALSFLYWTLRKKSPLKQLQYLGYTIVLFLHFSICLMLACYQLNCGHAYPLSYLLTHYFFNATALLQFIHLPSLVHIAHPFSYVNYAGLFAVLVLPFLFGLILAEKSKFKRIILALGILYAGVLLVASKCKGSYLSFGCVLGISLILFLKAKIKIPMKVRWGIGFGIVSFFLIICYKTPKLQSIITQLASGDVKGFASTRWYAMQDGFKIFSQKPLWGHGITTTPLYYLESYPNVVHHCWQLHVPLVQFLIEFGLVGGISFLSVFFFVFYAGIKTLKNPKLPREYRYPLLGCLLSCVAYVSFVSESSWDMFVISSFMCFVAGFIILLYINYSDFKKLDTRMVCGLRGVYCLVFILVCFTSIRDVLGRYYFREFLIKAQNTGLSCIQSLDKALCYDPHNLYYLNHGGYYFSCKGYLKSKELTQKSVQYYERSLQVNAYQPEVLESLGALHMSLKNMSQAIHYFCTAISILPHHSFAYVQLLDALKHYKQENLYNEWLALTTFINPLISFSQPDLLDYLLTHKSVQQKCLAYFSYVEEQFDSKLKRNDLWILEQHFRKRLFGFPAEKLPSKHLCLNSEDKDKFLSYNYLYATNPKNLLDCIADQPRRTRHYYVPLDQHSSPQILLHGSGGPALLITTLKSIYMPKNDLHVWASGIFAKHSRELLSPLIQKTQAVFQ